MSETKDGQGLICDECEDMNPTYLTAYIAGWKIIGVKTYCMLCQAKLQIGDFKPFKAEE